ncbi:MAG: hypothetical protein AAF514_00020 [Verrucomicrobiota bacterium]
MAYGPQFEKAKALMNEALKANPFVPMLFHHPTSLYPEAPPSYELGSPDEAMFFLRRHGIDWLGSMIGWLYMNSFQIFAVNLAKKASRAMRESYKELEDFLDGIAEPRWQGLAINELEKLS